MSVPYIQYHPGIVINIIFMSVPYMQYPISIEIFLTFMSACIQYPLGIDIFIAFMSALNTISSRYKHIPYFYVSPKYNILQV